MNDNFINNIVKEYPSMYKLTVFKFPKARYSTTSSKKGKYNRSQELDIARSVRRSRMMVSDYILSNDFDMFVTFTFNPKKVNRYDLNACYFKMQSWLSRQQRKSENMMKYVIVPEKHKDGAIHFHAVMLNYPGLIKKTNVIQNNRRVYNLTSFRFGFTNMQYLDDDKQKVAAYVCKYITKDMVTVSNRRRYWASKNLQKPVKYYNEANNLSLDPDLHSLTFENQYLQMHEFEKLEQLFA